MGRVNSHIASGGTSKWDALQYIKTGFALQTQDIQGTEFVLDVPKRVQDLNTQLFAASISLPTSVTTITIKKTEDEANYPITKIGGWFYGNMVTTTLNLEIDTSSVTSVASWFCGYYSKLTHIIGDWDFSGLTSDINQNVFGSYVETLTIKSGTLSRNCNLSGCNNLTDTSLASIIDGLADLTGGTGQTLTLHATPKARLTNEQIATITAKNWTLA